MIIAALEAAKMRQSSGLRQQSEEKHIKEFSRRTQRKFATEEKMRIVLAGLRGEAPVAELCRREGAAESPCCCWSKESLEAGMWRLARDTAREAYSRMRPAIAWRLSLASVSSPRPPLPLPSPIRACSGRGASSLPSWGSCRDRTHPAARTALANKTARIAWAVLSRREDCRAPAMI